MFTETNPMRNITQVIAVVLLLGCFSCQQEAVFEETRAEGTLKSAASGDCLPSSVSGLYKKDTVLTNANYIEVQARMSSTGSYKIYSDTINGYYFQAEGVAADTGLQTIRLTGRGTPTSTGINNFSLRFGNSVCKVPVSVTGSTGNTSAIFTMGLSGSNCTGVVLAGTYTAGTAMNAQNTIKADVTVNSIGSFNLSTNTVNGVSFAASGVFSNPGNQQVTLTATGTPVNSGLFTYSISSGSSQCQFSVTYGSGSSAATFSTRNTAGLCNPITINGTYKAGQPLMAPEHIIVEVNVTTPGTYSMTTAPAVNGLVFNAAGTFTTTGIIPVTMYGIGTPLTAGTHTFTVAGPNGCSFPLTTQPNGGSSTGTFTCKINGVFTTFNIDAHAKLSFPQTGWGQAMELQGKASTTSAENLYIALNRTQNGVLITPGNYGWGTSFNYLQFYYRAPDAAFWYGISTVNMVYMTITSVSASRIKGTFSGKVFDNGGWGSNFKVLSEGLFDVPIQ